MSPKRPYLLKAFYDWLTENQDVPFILVNADEVDGLVPVSAVKEGTVVLNIAPTAVENLDIGIEFMSFQCRFNGVSTALKVPMRSIFSIYGKASGQGLEFDKEEYEEERLSKTFEKPDSKLRLV